VTQDTGWRHPDPNHLTFVADGQAARITFTVNNLQGECSVRGAWMRRFDLDNPPPEQRRQMVR